MWTTCWKCEKQIKSQADCNFIKSRNGNFDYCPSCYDEFINHNKEFIRPERSKREELKRSLRHALSNFHDEMFQLKKAIYKTSKNIATTLIHKQEEFYDCEVCKEILSMRCSEHCGNTVRDK